VPVVLASVLLQGCAMKGDIKRLEAELQTYHTQVSTSDSARALALVRLLDQATRSHQETQQLLDSVTSEVRQLTLALGDLRGELTSVQRQLVAVQELAGQSETRLRELSLAIAAIAGAGTGLAAVASGESGKAGDTSAEQLYASALQQLRRDRPSTARGAFHELLRAYPDHPLIPDALYWIGDSFVEDNPDSAMAYLNHVVDEYPQSPRAPSALYKVGLEAERRGETAQAHATFERVATEYGLSDAAQLACQKLRAAGRTNVAACRGG
jgi:tol-pal system protein YbgF